MSIHSYHLVLENVIFGLHGIVSNTVDTVYLNLLKGSEVKASASNAGDWVRSLGREDPLEKEMALHSSTLAWRIPWREETGGLQSTGSQRVRHD